MSDALLIDDTPEHHQPAPGRGEPMTAESPAPPLGISCPQCNTALETVLFTRKAPGQILRVRKCEPCKRRWRTAERIIPGVPRGRDEAAEAG